MTLRNLTLVLLFAMVLQACGNKTEKNESENAVVEIKHWPMEYANRFSVDYLPEDLTRININQPWSGSDENFAMLLSDAGIEYAIHTPAQSIVCLSPTHIEMLKLLGQQNKIVGVSDYEDVYDDSLRAYFQSRNVLEVGKGKGLNYESLIELQPNLIIESASGAGADAIKLLEEYHLPAALFSAHMENHPLGRLEWMKYISLFVDDTAHAAEIFEAKKKVYNQLKNGVEPKEHKPKVFVGYKWRDNWYMLGGKNYFIKFIEDAGGEYILASDTTAGSAQVGHEKVIELLQESDIWLHPGYQVFNDKDLDDLKIPASYFDNGLQVYNNNKRINEFKKNDFWSSGFINPELVLQDLIHLMGKDTSDLTYYHRIK